MDMRGVIRSLRRNSFFSLSRDILSFFSHPLLASLPSPFLFPSRCQTSINIEPSARWLSSLISRRGIDLVRPHRGRTGILRPLQTQVQTVSNAGKRSLAIFKLSPLILSLVSAYLECRGFDRVYDS